jgi:glycosyltransferase involved in cell wall biosynthesis
LLRSYALVKDKVKAKLVILGEGKERRNLENLSRELLIEDRVILYGYVNNPYKFMRNAEIFVLSSKLEGFPNVLLEAMAVGVPVVSFDCPTGPNEIITNRENGILVEPGNEKELSDAIIELLSNKDMGKKFVANGLPRAEDFSIDKIIPQFTSLF